MKPNIAVPFIPQLDFEAGRLFLQKISFEAVKLLSFGDHFAELIFADGSMCRIQIQEPSQRRELVEWANASAIHSDQ